ncbi:MAG TPA: type II secretion system F family protein [Dongiaceae bacterium]|nr:type II secretion system F family protein [Dongiaceae bacterium]
MASFSYVARDARTGLEVLDTLEADTEEAAIESLWKRDRLVVSIEEKQSKKARAPGGRVPLKDLVLFTRQFATMFDAGMSVVGCFKGLEKQTRNKMMRHVIQDLCARIERGDSLSDALAKNPHVFDKLYLCMAAAGEKGGMLAEILSRIATYLENTARLRRKVKSAMMYPTVVTVVAIGITIFLLAKVVPVFAEIFESFKGKLPAPTVVLIGLSDIVRHWLLLILLGMGGVVYGWFHFIKTRIGREFWDTWRIRLPMFGPIAHSICLARFARTYSSLVRSGVPILSVMQTVSEACGNVVMEKAINAAAQDLQLGEGISDSLGKHPVFPDMVIRMMSVGEQTGKIDHMMERVADYLDEEVEGVLSGLTSMIEPLLVVFLGVVVGSIVICVFLPIFKLSSIITGGH